MKQLTPIRPLALALIALGIVVVSVGCSGTDAPALATSSMTKAEFANRVEAICSRGRREALRYQPAGRGESQRDALTKAIDNTLLPSLGKAIEKIYALGAPPAEKEQTEALLVAMQEAVDRGEDLDVPTVERIEDFFAFPGRLARRAGLVSCVYG